MLAIRDGQVPKDCFDEGCHAGKALAQRVCLCMKGGMKHEEGVWQKNEDNLLVVALLEKARIGSIWNVERHGGEMVRLAKLARAHLDTTGWDGEALQSGPARK